MTPQPKQTSSCHNAPVKLVGGRGDFSDHEEGITMHWVCTACGEMCDLAGGPQQEPAEGGELRERLAAIEHVRWARWQNYLHSFLVWNNDIKAWTLLHEHKDHWQGLVNTPYAMLTEKQKQSDREEVDRCWPLIEAEIASRLSAMVDSLEAEIPEDAKPEPLDNDENKAWCRGRNETLDQWRAVLARKRETL